MTSRDQKSEERGRQNENSRQSGPQGGQKSQRGRPGGSGKQDGAGIGSSQGQDRASSREKQERTDRSTGTADVERGAQQSAPDSMVNEMTGAYKERP
jgi:hypothetical protein